MMRLLLLTLALLPLLPVWAPTASASEIYRWTDDDGVVHYSDTEPDYSVVPVTLYVKDTNPPGYDPTKDPYSIRNQAKRTSASWTELAKAREEREEKRREEAGRNRNSAPPPYDPYDYPYLRSYGPAYFSSIHPIKHRRSQRKLVGRQLHALEELGLTGPRPHSINSGTHHARVQRSRNLPVVATKPGPAGKMPHR